MMDMAPMTKYAGGSTMKKKMRAMVSRKIRINMREMKAGNLHSGSAHGPLVTNPKQAIAISYSQARRQK